MKFLIFILSILLYLCTNTQHSYNLSGTKWSLIKITNLVTNQNQFADSTCKTTLNFINTIDYNGYSGWNQYNGHYTVKENNKLFMDLPFRTKRMGTRNCALGEKLYDHFPKAKAFIIKADTLFLFTNDSIKITFKKINLQ